MGKLGPAAQTAVPHLLPLLLVPAEDEHPFIAWETFTALGAIGGPMREQIAGELAALVACARQCRSDLRALHAFQTVRLGKPPSPLPEIPDYLAKDQFHDSLRIQGTIEALIALREPVATVVAALRDAVAIPNAQVRQCAIRGLLAVESAWQEGVACALKLLRERPAKAGALHSPTALDALYRAGRGFDTIVLRLLDLADLPPVSWHDPAPGLSRFVASERFTACVPLAEHTGDANPAVRAHATRLLGYLGARARRFVGRLLSLLDDVDGDVCAAAVESLAQLDCREPEVLQALAACGQRHRGTSLNDRITEFLRGMGGAATAVDGVDLARSALAYFALDADLCGDGEAHVADGVVLVPWTRILKSEGNDAWATDEDEVGMLGVSPGGTPSLAMATLPVLLPLQPTGASGAKRVFELRAVTAAGLLCSLRVPFSDQRGWGDDNYAYMFDPATRGWSRVSRAEQPPGYQMTPLHEPRAPENPHHALCSGELVVHAAPGGNGLVFACDATPYHLDDWVHTPEISAVLQAQGLLRTRARADCCEVSAPTPQRWEVQRDAGAEPIVLRFVRQFVLDHDRRQPAASVSAVKPIVAAMVGSRLVLGLRICRLDGTEVDAALVIEV